MNTTPDLIVKILQRFLLLFPGQLSPENAQYAAKHWHDALYDLDGKELAMAADLVVMQRREFPTPSDLRLAVYTIQAVRAVEARHAAQAIED